MSNEKQTGAAGMGNEELLHRYEWLTEQEGLTRLQADESRWLRAEILKRMSAPRATGAQPEPLNAANQEANAGLAITFWPAFCRQELLYEGQPDAEWWGYKWAGYAMARLEEMRIAACQSAAPRPACPTCGNGKLLLKVDGLKLSVLCQHCGWFPVETISPQVADLLPFFPAPAGGEQATSEQVCPYRLGQTVYWQGQDGQKRGEIHNITEPEPGNYVLWFADDSLVNAAQVTASPQTVPQTRTDSLPDVGTYEAPVYSCDAVQTETCEMGNETPCEACGASPEPPQGAGEPHNPNWHEQLMQPAAAPSEAVRAGDVQGYCVVCKTCGKGEYQPGLYFHAPDDCDGGFMAVAIRKFPELARAEKALEVKE